MTGITLIFILECFGKWNWKKTNVDFKAHIWHSK